MDQSIQNDLNAPHSMGTTIIGVTYNGGVVLGADSRTSTGVYVANRASDKITQLTDNIYLCRSGSAADSQIVSDYVRHFLHQHTIQLGQPATVKVAANLIRLFSYNNKNMLQTGLIIGGWDKYEGGKIYGVPLGGTILEQPFAIGGSGSTYLYGFFDQEWKEGMTKEEAEQLVVKAVSLAIARDGASGGVVRTVIPVLLVQDTDFWKYKAISVRLVTAVTWFSYKFRRGDKKLLSRRRPSALARGAGTPEFYAGYIVIIFIWSRHDDKLKTVVSLKTGGFAPFERFGLEVTCGVERRRPIDVFVLNNLEHALVHKKIRA
ncbi:hypothetical protein C1H46_005838 [Malus baccata]|uniref:Proteasome subunit beta n=1 Tax=Malus baccata TaxID=106549 RepID=A0A540NBW4_MALBA|nr:hypothetical protein C1H46_005838 [Malus baccata]